MKIFNRSEEDGKYWREETKMDDAREIENFLEKRKEVVDGELGLRSTRVLILTVKKMTSAFDNQICAY